MSIIKSSILHISILPYFTSNGFDENVISPTSNKILLLNLLNLLDILIKVFNMSFLALSNDLYKNYHLKDYL